MFGILLKQEVQQSINNSYKKNYQVLVESSTPLKKKKGLALFSGGGQKRRKLCTSLHFKQEVTCRSHSALSALFCGI